MSNNNNTNNNTERKYFDLHATGVGYVNRPRLVKPEHGDSFYALDISALRGHSEQEKKTYTKFSTRVAGKEAKEVIAKHLNAMQVKDAKVLISFVVGDIQPSSYNWTDKQTGEVLTGCNIDGRLIVIKSLKINGEVVFKRTKNDDESETETEVEAKAEVEVEVEAEI